MIKATDLAPRARRHHGTSTPAAVTGVATVGLPPANTPGAAALIVLAGLAVAITGALGPATGGRNQDHHFASRSSSSRSCSIMRVSRLRS